MVVLKDKSFTCVKCEQTKPIQTEGGTGYGVDPQGNKICYDCCAILDREQMILQGRATLYLVKRFFHMKQSSGGVNLPIRMIRILFSVTL